MSTNRLTLFISYAHEDEALRQQLDKHLATLRREGLVEAWHDREITAGKDWAGEIDAALDRAHIVLLLVSPDFMASEYCNEIETKRAMQREQMGTSRVIPVLLRPADWSAAPFARLQAVPTGARPVTDWPDRDAAFLDVVQHLRKVCRELAAIPGNPANPYVAANVGDWYEGEVVVEVLPTGATQLATLRVTVIDKDEHLAVLRMQIESQDLGNSDKSVEIPLDQPLEDALGTTVNAVAGQQIPANVTVEFRQTGAGSEKLFIGGRTYYTTWVAGDAEMRMGRERVVQKGKRWLCSEVPLDGIVKLVMEVPGVVRQTMIVTGYGRAGAGKQAPVQPPRPAPPPAPPTLDRLLIGNWNVQIQPPFGLPAGAMFQFNAQGQFAGQVMAGAGMTHVQGQWQAQGNVLALQGVQSAGFMNVPYAAVVTFHNVSPQQLAGVTQTGEQVTFSRG
jgi:hypothetical protein